MKALKSLRTSIRVIAVLLALAAIPVLVMGWLPSMQEAYVAHLERVSVNGPVDSRDAQIDSLQVGGKAALGQVSFTVTQSTIRGNARKVAPGWQTETVKVPNAMQNWEGGLYSFVAKPIYQTTSTGTSTRGFTVGAPMGFLLLVCALILMSEARHLVKPDKKAK